MSTPKASARTLLVLSGPVVTCRKNTRCTPICAMASTASAIGMLGVQTRSSAGSRKATTVSSAASAEPDDIADDAAADLVALAGLVAGRGVGATGFGASLIERLHRGRRR